MVASPAQNLLATQMTSLMDKIAAHCEDLVPLGVFNTGCSISALLPAALGCSTAISASRLRGVGRGVNALLASATSCFTALRVIDFESRGFH